jgi:hypothetical protein
VSYFVLVSSFALLLCLSCIYFVSKLHSFGVSFLSHVVLLVTRFPTSYHMPKYEFLCKSYGPVKLILSFAIRCP